MTTPDPIPERDTPARDAVAGMSGPDGPLLRLVKDRRLAFLIVGGLNTAIGFAWFVVFSSLFDHWFPASRLTDVPVLLSAQVMASLSAFVMFRRLVFRVRGHAWLDFARFQLVSVPVMLLNIVALPVMTQVFGWHRVPSQLLFTIVITVYSWFAHSRFSFRRRAPQPSASE